MEKGTLDSKGTKGGGRYRDNISASNQVDFKSLVASPLQASLTRLWLASLFRRRLKSTKGMEICFNPGPSKVTLMLH